MDDNLEQPSFPPPREPVVEDADEELSEDEDEGPDWTKLPSYTSTTKPSLPKRGDKEFEPAANGPTNLQAHSLNRARDAMFGALGAERGISNKSVSYAVWYPALARAHVTLARGVHFNGMGHSIARPASVFEGKHKSHRRTELLPEETLYLIERGGLFCWKQEPTIRSSGHRDEAHADVDTEDVPGEGGMHGSPMSVQQAFTEMIGRDDLTLERYHAFAYLKRLGFNVLRTKPPSPSYPIPPPVVHLQPSQSPFLARFFHPFVNLFARLRCWMFGRVDWWKPLGFGSWLGCARNYPAVYRSLRLVPSGHSAPLYAPSSVPTPPEPPNDIAEKPTPYEIFYNIYKPNTPFRKSSPPPPDFSLVVVNARTTPLPTIHELTHLWSFLPETGPPVPRQRNRTKLPQNSRTAQMKPPPPPPPSRLFSWLLGRRHENQTMGPPSRKPHPIAVLKGGKKTVVIGVVDSGTVGFFRFGMGAFEEMPMI